MSYLYLDFDTIFLFDLQTGQFMALLYTNQKNKNYLDNIVRSMILKKNGIIPKYGIVSLILERTPIVIVRDLGKIIGCNTACTDGVRIMFDEDFLEKMFEEEREHYNKLKANNIVMIDQNTGRAEVDDEFLEKGTEFILMHEAYHIVMRHASRITLRKFYEMAEREPTLYTVINAALDLKINTNLRLGFPRQRVLNSLLKTGVGFDPESLKKYPLMAEELIVEEAFRKYDQNKRDYRDRFQQNAQNAVSQPNQQGQGQPNQQGQGQPNQQGQGQPNQQGQGQPNQQGQGQPNQQGQGQPNQQGQGQPNQQGQGQPNQQGQGQPNQQGQGQPNQQDNLNPQDQLNGASSGSQSGQVQSGSNNQSGGGNGSPNATDDEIKKSIEELAQKLNRDAETLQQIFEKNRPDNWDEMTSQDRILNSEAFKKSYVDEIGSDPDQSSRDAKAGVPNAPYIPNLGQMLGTTANSRGALQNGNPDAIPLEELIRRLREAKREDLIETMGLPKPEDKDYKERLKNLRDRTENMIKQSISKAKQIEDRTGSLPGSHIADEADAYVQVELKKKLDWKFYLRKRLFGDGPRTTRDKEMPDILYFNDDLTAELGQPYYEESLISYKNTDAILVLVDTSGSMSFNNALIDSLSEIFALQASAKRKYSAPKVVLLWADTVIRGEPMIITKENYKSFITDNKVKVSGLGGTDIIGSINEALNNELIKKEVLGELKVKDVVVFSDLEFYYNASGVKIPKGVSISMIAPECVSEKLVEEAQKAMPWANLFHIGHERTVDLRKATRITEELQKKYFEKK